MDVGPRIATIGRMDQREQMRKWLDRRERLGLTLRELSEETGVPVETLGHWAWKLRQEDVGSRPCGASSSPFVGNRHAGHA